MNDNKLYTGEVKFFHTSKGYGFIVCGVSEYFFHYSDMNDLNLSRGDQVSFSLGHNKQGTKAINIKRIS
jgi:cold shock CspA family protein